MVIIKDRVAGFKKFPIVQLLKALVLHLKIRSESVVRVLRIGGPGKKIWNIESRIDSGLDVILPFHQLEEIANSQDDYLDELLGIQDQVIFGISDATFMFVQSEKKRLEHLIASEFRAVEEAPDRNFG